MLASLLGIVNKLLGLLGFGAAEAHDAEQRQQGAIAQDCADKDATIKEAQIARVIEASDAALGDADLDRRLRRPGANP